jgi:hypothetical protein
MPAGRGMRAGGGHADQDIGQLLADNFGAIGQLLVDREIFAEGSEPRCRVACALPGGFAG